MANCMRGNIGVTLISKAFKMIKIKDLVDLLYDQTIREHNAKKLKGNDNLIKYIQTAKSAAIDIMLTFFMNSNHALDDLPDCSKVDDFYHGYLIFIETFRLCKIGN